MTIATRLALTVALVMLTSCGRSQEAESPTVPAEFEKCREIGDHFAHTLIESGLESAFALLLPHSEMDRDELAHAKVASQALLDAARNSYGVLVDCVLVKCEHVAGTVWRLSYLVKFEQGFLKLALTFYINKNEPIVLRFAMDQNVEAMYEPGLFTRILISSSAQLRSAA